MAWICHNWGETLSSERIIENDLDDSGSADTLIAGQVSEKALLSTEDYLIAEAAPRDKIWGIGMGVNNSELNERIDYV